MALTFEQVVAEWLRRRGNSVAEVSKVTAFGTDWAGDTEGGFHLESNVTILFTDAQGRGRFREVGGEEMADLWQHVMKSWPADA